MAHGSLVPSLLITTLLQRKLRGIGGRRLLLDGFPRSRQNAVEFQEQCGRPELALHLVCDEEVMVERILRRAESQGRSDDNIETARRRIAAADVRSGHRSWTHEGSMGTSSTGCQKRKGGVCIGVTTTTPMTTTGPATTTQQQVNAAAALLADIT